ncbi:MAG: hypothetical protein ACOC7T_05265 [Planctomycetota bacterium]
MADSGAIVKVAVVVTLLLAAGASGGLAETGHASPYTRWENGPPTDPGFFPLGVWAQSADSAPRFREVGINTYVGGWGFDEERMEYMRESGMGVICSFNDYARKHIGNEHFWAWMSAHEPDNARSLSRYWDNDIGRIKREWPQLRNTDIQWGVPVPPRRVIRQHNRLKRRDPSRPTFLILGRSVAHDQWVGRGHRTNHPEDYRQYVKGGDIVSYDIYPATARQEEVRGRLWYVARGLRRLHRLTSEEQVVWNFVGATNRTPGPRGTPDPGAVRSQVWISLIHGSKGIVYFVHQFRPRFIEASVLEDPEMAEGFARINRRVAELAPVLNSPTIGDGTETVCSVPAGEELAAAGLDPLAAMTKRHGGATYVFAVRMEGSPARGAFRVAGLPAQATAEVLGERRTLPVRDGRFSDRFAGYEVHLYRITSGPGRRRR